ETFSKLKIHQEKLERDCGTPVLTFIGIDKLIHLYETNQLKKHLSREVALCKTGNNLTIALGSEQQEDIMKTLGHMVSNHWKLELYNKCLLFHGVQPETELYAVTCDSSEGFISTNLTEIA
ncbi:MAG: hypothetical protein ACTSVE_05835, partial [Candidatus Helarchaeota archaeon]